MLNLSGEGERASEREKTSIGIILTGSPLRYMLICVASLEQSNKGPQYVLHGKNRNSSPITIKPLVTRAATPSPLLHPDLQSQALDYYGQSKSMSAFNKCQTCLEVYIVWYAASKLKHSQLQKMLWLSTALKSMDWCQQKGHNLHIISGLGCSKYRKLSEAARQGFTWYSSTNISKTLTFFSVKNGSPLHLKMYHLLY